MSKIKAGVGKTLIDIHGLLPYQGFSTINDNLFVRSLFLEDNNQHLFVTIDVTALKDEDIFEIKELINNIFSINGEDIWIIANHNFSSIHTRSKDALATADEEIVVKDKSFREILKNAVIKSIRESIKNIENVKLGFQYGNCNINKNRNRNGMIDNELGIIKIINNENQLKGVIYNYAIQSSYMEKYKNIDDSKVISADIVGYVSSKIEAENSSCVAFFMIGSGGDQVPREKYNYEEKNMISVKDLYQYMSILGDSLFDEIIKNINLIECKNYDFESMKLIKIIKFSDENSQIPVFLINFGPIIFIGLQPELTATLGLEIKKSINAPITIITTMVNGGKKYLPHKEAYELGTYEAKSSMFCVGDGEKVVKEIIKTANEMREKNENWNSQI